MLQILQSNNTENYKEQFDRLDAFDVDLKLVEAVDGDDILGSGIYHFEDGKLVVDHVDSKGDLCLFDGIVRSVLFLAMLKGIDIAELRLEDMEYAVKLGFVQNNDNFIQSITNFMSKCKSCGK